MTVLNIPGRSWLPEEPGLFEDAWLYRHAGLRTGAVSLVILLLLGSGDALDPLSEHGPVFYSKTGPNTQTMVSGLLYLTQFIRG